MLTDAESAALPAAFVVFASRNSVRVTLRNADGSAVSRDASFRDEDPDAERWHAIALIVASLASEHAPPTPPPAPPRPDPEQVTWATISAETGDGVEPGPARFGGNLRLALRPRGFIGYFAAGVGFASSQSVGTGVRPSFLPISLGAGLVFEFESRLALRPRLDVLIERQHVTATGTSLGPGTGSRWVPGVGATVELVFPARGPVSLVFGGNARYANGATGIYVGRDRVALFPAHSYGMHLGLDIALDAFFGVARD